jgi:hypothetical protein
MIYFVRLLLEFFPFCSSSMAQRLSWYRTDCAYTKNLVHIIAGEASSAPTSSDSIDLLVLFFSLQHSNN